MKLLPAGLALALTACSDDVGGAGDGGSDGDALDLLSICEHTVSCVAEECSDEHAALNALDRPPGVPESNPEEWALYQDAVEAGRAALAACQTECVGFEISGHHNCSALVFEDWYYECTAAYSAARAFSCDPCGLFK